MDDSTRIILTALISNIARSDSGPDFAAGLAQDLWQAVEELQGHPVTTGEIGKFAELASQLRDE